MTPLESTLLGAIISAGAGILVAFFTIRYQEMQRRKKEHLKEIKNKVLNPFMEMLNRCYVPTVNGRLVNIVDTIKQKQTGLISEEEFEKASKELEFELKISDLYEGTLSRFIPDDKLYSCTKAKHFPEFMKRYEEFERRFDEYHKSCLNAARKIRGEIKNEVSLPSFKGISGGTTPYICENSLAIFVLKKRVEKNNNNFLKIKENKDVASLKIMGPSAGRDEVAQGNLKQVKECKEKMENLARKKDYAEDLVKQAELLIPKAKALRNEAEELLRQTKLPGKCKYL